MDASEDNRLGDTEVIAQVSISSYDYYMNSDCGSTSSDEVRRTVLATYERLNKYL